MPITTVGVVSAITPSVIETYFSHYFNRGPLRQKPTAHLTYHEGLRLVRQFLEYSSKHTVEDLQAFTAQWVPAPTWVKIDSIDIPSQCLAISAQLIRDQLGPRGIELVGGKSWWQWRRPDTRLRAEWIEMKKDAVERKRLGTEFDRVLLYIHGGAYYFGSVDEHRYQMQRHARKLKARVFAPRYRLAPQYPFPCGLQDCIAAYLLLLDTFDPSQILVAGDSAGGGMVLSMLVTLRDQGKPLPAGTILLSPWVDLVHSFPSVAGDGDGDYIPPHGFHHKPSMCWPPPGTDELRELNGGNASDDSKDLNVVIDGQNFSIKDQIQMYSTNQMLAHPLVSPVQQPSLGGLPPMLIQVGGGELLRDEQIYLAHKAANPEQYPPNDTIIADYGLNKADVEKYPPTNVQLQVWDDLCHVPHTLSFTRPAKYMFRSVAQFGAWALAHAQHTTIEIDDDANSLISSGPDTDNEGPDPMSEPPPTPKKGARPAEKVDFSERRVRKRPTGAVGKAGDALPPFRDHMIRQRVDRHGITYALTVPSELKCLHLDPNSIGAVKPGPVKKWMAKKKEMDAKFTNERRKVQKKRLKEIARGYDVLAEGEKPPPTALAGRRRQDMPAERRVKKSWGLALWSGWGSHHDETTIERTEKVDEQAPSQRDESMTTESENTAMAANISRTDMLAPQADTRNTRRTSSASMLSVPISEINTDHRPRSPYRKVSDAGQAEEHQPVPTTMEPKAVNRALSVASSRPVSQSLTLNEPLPIHELPSPPLPSQEKLTAPTASDVAPNSTKVEGSENTFVSSNSSRPHNGTVAYPFKIRNPAPNPSITTLEGDGSSVAGTTTTRSTPNASIAPTESMVAEKEVAIPYYEKEVVVMPAPSPQNFTNNSPASAGEHWQNTHRMRNPPSDPRLNSKVDNYPSSSSLPTNNSSASLPTSPVDPYRAVRSPAFNPAGAANTVFGGSPTEQNDPDRIQQVNMGPPKPVGFAYNPRDLRNAMINRQAAENAAAAAARMHASPAPVQRQNTAPASPTMGLPHMITPVELPAFSKPSPEPATPARSPAVAVNESDPIELSTVKQTRISILPPPRSNPSPTPTVELSATKQTRNSVLPPPRTQPRPGPSDIARPDSTALEPSASFLAPINLESPSFRSSFADSASLSSSASDDPVIRENVTMPVVETRTTPLQIPVLPFEDDESVPPTPPPKDIQYLKPGGNAFKDAAFAKATQSPQSPQKKPAGVNGFSDGALSNGNGQRLVGK